jgi:hypothetical protein
MILVWVSCPDFVGMGCALGVLTMAGVVPIQQIYEFLTHNNQDSIPGSTPDSITDSTPVSTAVSTAVSTRGSSRLSSPVSSEVSSRLSSRLSGRLSSSKGVWDSIPPYHLAFQSNPLSVMRLYHLGIFKNLAYMQPSL